MQRNASRFTEKTRFQTLLAALAGVVAAAAVVAAATATAVGAVTAATAADEQDEDDDPPAVKTVVPRIVAHNKFLLFQKFHSHTIGQTGRWCSFFEKK